MPFLKYKHLKLKLRVFLAVHSVAMVTYCVTKIIIIIIVIISIIIIIIIIIISIIICE